MGYKLRRFSNLTEKKSLVRKIVNDANLKLNRREFQDFMNRNATLFYT